MKRKHAILLILIPVYYGYLALFSNALTDDAFITLQYVKTLLSTGTWGFFPGDVVNAVTSPLNIFLLSFAGIFFGPTINAVLWLTALTLALTTLLLTQISAQLFETEFFGYVTAAALTLNPLLLSTLGLESMIFVALYVLCAYLYLNHRWSLLAIGLGLITLTRFDGVLFFLVTLLLLPSPKLATKFTTIYTLSVAPWYIFSWIYFGSLLPDTLFIKTAQRAWGTWEFLNGIGLYFSAYRTQVFLSLLLLPFVFLIFRKEIRNLALIQFLILTASAHFIGYSLLHVPPYYWYYVPEVAAITIIGGLSLGQLFYQNRSVPWKATVIRGIAVILILLQVAGIFSFASEDQFSISEMPIHTNWGTHEQYKAIGTWLKANNDGGMILVDGEIGTLGYYCDCRLSSFFSDRKWLRLYVKKQLSETGTRAMLYKVNFLFIDLDTSSTQPSYLLQEIPGGAGNADTRLMEWNISSKWTPATVVRFSRYSP